MLVPEWEQYATKLANTSSTSLVEVLLALVEKVKVPITSSDGKC